MKTILSSGGIVFALILALLNPAHSAEPLVKVSLGAQNSPAVGVPGAMARITRRTRLPHVVAAPENSFVVVNGRRYRGRIICTKSSGNRIALVNELRLEDYLRGVVPSEMPAGWPIEALKAQAVVARSYALWRNGFSFDQSSTAGTILASTVSDQVYRGASAERETSNAAVDATRGEVLLYAGGVVPAYFHSTCGGITERASSVWPRVAARYSPSDPWALASRDVFVPSADAECLASPHNAWRISESSRSMAQRLKGLIRGLSLVDSVSIAARNESGRAQDFLVVGRDAKKRRLSKTIDGNTFRLAMNPNRLKSLLCDIEANGGTFVFRGRGWGHGVGLCQFGARAMAERGFNYRQILERYYPGAELRSIMADDGVETEAR